MFLSINFDFSLIDADAITICIVGYVIVFIALVLLYFVFNNLPRILKIKLSLKRKSKDEFNVPEFSVTGEVNAAIGMALHMYFNELHDEESNIITIKRASKFYSPWSSKIYGLRNYQRN